MSEKPQPKFDERAVKELFDLGWGDIVAYLRAWARFDRWCAENERP